MKTTWKQLISEVKKMKGNTYTFTVYANHYLFGYSKANSVSYTFKNKWRCLINMKIYAILYNLSYSNDYGIYYRMECDS